MKNPINDFTTANQFFREGKPMQAIVFYRRAIQQNPQFYALYENLGDALTQLDFNEDAEAAYKTAIELNPASAWPHAQIGRIKASQNHYAEAIAAYRRAIDRSPTCIPFYHDLSQTLITQGKPQGASKTFKRLGAILREQGQLSAAIAAYSQALNLNPNAAEIHQALGECLHRQGQHSEAAFYYQAAMQQDPNRHLWYYKTFSETLSAAAASSAETTLSEVPESVWFHYHKGRTLAQVGECDQAIAHYQACIEMQPQFAEAYTALLQLQPHRTELYQQLAQILAAQNQPNQAKVIAQLHQRLVDNAEQGQT